MTTASSALLKFKGYTGSVEVSLEDGCLHGRLLHIDDLITYGGNTVAELKAEFEMAVDEYLAHCQQIGKQPNKPYTGSFNVRIGSERHLWLVEAAHQAQCSLNEMVCQAVDGLIRSHASPGRADAEPAHTWWSQTIEPQQPMAMPHVHQFLSETLVNAQFAEHADGHYFIAISHAPGLAVEMATSDTYRIAETSAGIAAAAIKRAGGHKRGMV